MDIDRDDSVTSSSNAASFKKCRSKDPNDAKHAVYLEKQRQRMVEYRKRKKEEWTEEEKEEHKRYERERRRVQRAKKRALKLGNSDPLLFNEIKYPSTRSLGSIQKIKEYKRQVELKKKKKTTMTEDEKEKRKKIKTEKQRLRRSEAKALKQIPQKENKTLNPSEYVEFKKQIEKRINMRTEYKMMKEEKEEVNSLWETIKNECFQLSQINNNSEINLNKEILNFRKPLELSQSKGAIDSRLYRAKLKANDTEGYLLKRRARISAMRKKKKAEMTKEELEKFRKNNRERQRRLRLSKKLYECERKCVQRTVLKAHKLEEEVFDPLEILELTCIKKDDYNEI